MTLLYRLDASLKRLDFLLLSEDFFFHLISSIIIETNTEVSPTLYTEDITYLPKHIENQEPSALL